jgi:hypothetical protein
LAAYLPNGNFSFHIQILRAQCDRPLTLNNKINKLNLIQNREQKL